MVKFSFFSLYERIILNYLGENCAFIHDEYKRSSIIIKPGYIYAPRSVQPSGEQTTIDEQEYQQRSRRSSSGYASNDERLSI